MSPFLWWAKFQHRAHHLFCKYGRDLANELTVGFVAQRVSDRGGSIATELIVFDIDQVRSFARVVFELDSVSLSLARPSQTVAKFVGVWKSSTSCV